MDNKLLGKSALGNAGFRVILYIIFWCFLTFSLNQRRLDPGKESLEGFFQVGNLKDYQNVVIISFVHLEKVNFCFMHKNVAQKLSPPHPLEK